MTQSAPCASLDAHARGEEDRSTLGELIADPASNEHFDSMDRHLQKEHLGTWLSQLNEREQKILQLRFGLEGSEPLHPRRDRPADQRLPRTGAAAGGQGDHEASADEQSAPGRLSEPSMLALVSPPVEGRLHPARRCPGGGGLAGPVERCGPGVRRRWPEQREWSRKLVHIGAARWC